MGRAQNTVKRGSFWPYRVVGGRGRGPSLLRRGEKRLRQCHGQGAPGRIYEAYAWQPGAGKSRPVSPSGCCCCWPMLALFGRRFAPVLALGCCCCSCGCRPCFLLLLLALGGCCCCCCCCCCCGCRCRPFFLLLLLADVGPILGAGLPLSWP